MGGFGVFDIPVFGAPPKASGINEVGRSEHAEPVSEEVESRGHAVGMSAKVIVGVLSAQ